DSLLNSPYTTLETKLRDRLMSTTQEMPDADVIELMPTVHMDVVSPWVPGASAAYQPGVAVALAEGGLRSLVAETNTLRRKRLGATALLLSVVYAILLAWNFSALGDDLQTVWWLAAARLGLSVLVA